MASEIIVWSSFVFGLVAVIISLVSALQNSRVNRRDSYQMAYGMLIDLTTGEVEKARDVLGILRYGTGDWYHDITYSQVVRSFYRIEWALERTGYGLDWLHTAGRLVQSELSNALVWQVTELMGTLTLIRKSIGRSMVDDDSWSRLNKCVQDTGAIAAEPDEANLKECKRRLQILLNHEAVSDENTGSGSTRLAT